LQHSHAPPYQQFRYPPLHPGANQPIHTSQPPVAAGASHHCWSYVEGERIDLAVGM
ncbi:hypothetical protein MKW92_052285, partial [Papaver armeniacum]